MINIGKNLTMTLKKNLTEEPGKINMQFSLFSIMTNKTFLLMKKVCVLHNSDVHSVSLYAHTKCTSGRAIDVITFTWPIPF